MDRRAFLAAFSALGAGCMGGREGEAPAEVSATSTPTPTTSPVVTSIKPAADPWRETSEQSGDLTQVVSGEVVLPPGTFAVREFSPRLPVTVTIETEVLSEGRIGVVTMVERELSRYRDGGDFLGLSELSDSGVRTATLQTQISAGSYVVAFDNTVQTLQAPRRIKRASFSIEVSLESGTATPTASPQTDTPTTPRPELLPFGRFRKIGRAEITPFELREGSTEPDNERFKRAVLTVIATNSSDRTVQPPDITRFVLIDTAGDEVFENKGLSSWPTGVLPDERVRRNVWFDIPKTLSLNRLHAGYKIGEREYLRWKPD